ncbi:hypothetical protein AWW66_20830 [Micromonospora rosaria]|uniref:Uncharacterized protein n=1 Tax=Micromonospora rosaria TaxID=47874 RepID=A0A136PNY1_9ACTN|nr:hypothetical protein [Micromonospora rosaria]KXK60064.1 hypothetical protein AWW66_20830 [Micromonospora rosaria]
MGIDFSYANDEAIEQIGILDRFNNGEIDGFPNEHPDGWIQAVIDEVQAEIQSTYNPRTGSSNVDWSNYTDEERAAYEWYRDEVIPPEKWRAHVEEYQEESSDEDNVSYDEYQEPDEYDIDGDIDEPDVTTYTGTDNENGELKVSTEAIRHFVKQIDKVAWRGGGLLLDASNRFDTLDIRPGKFARAELMRQKIVGGGENRGLIGDTQGLLTQVHQTLFVLSDNLLQMANSYERTEEGNDRTGKDLEDRTREFNEMTESEFANAMGDSWGYIDGTGDFGQVSTDGSGGNDDSDDDSDDDSGGGDSGGDGQ